MKIYVGNLSFHTTADTLRAEFSVHDEVTDLHLVTDRETGRARGFAFVTMGSEQGAQKAIQAMNGAVVDGRPLKPWGDRHMWKYLLSDETLEAPASQPASQPAAGTATKPAARPTSQPPAEPGARE